MPLSWRTIDLFNSPRSWLIETDELTCLIERNQSLFCAEGRLGSRESKYLSIVKEVICLIFYLVWSRGTPFWKPDVQISPLHSSSDNSNLLIAMATRARFSCQQSLLPLYLDIPLKERAITLMARSFQSSEPSKPHQPSSPTIRQAR